MKKSVLRSILMLGAVVSTAALSAQAPRCPAVGTAPITNTYQNNVFFDLSTQPFSGGMIKITKSLTLQETNAAAENGLKLTIPNGYAKAMYWPDGSYYWLCSSSMGNYSLPDKVIYIEVWSEDILP